MIPVVCLMEWVLNSKHYTTKVISAVVVVAAGVGICTVTDVEVNAKGFICACVAVFCTSLQQIVSFSPSLILILDLCCYAFQIPLQDVKNTSYGYCNCQLLKRCFVNTIGLILF